MKIRVSPNRHKVSIRSDDVNMAEAESEDAGKEPNRNNRCREARFDHYPNIFDQLDAIWKQLESLRADGIKLHPAAEEMLGRIAGVKADFPKTQQ